MGQTLFEAAQELRTTLLRLGSLYGLQALDLNGLAAQDDTGTGPYWMIMMPELDEDLLDAADSLDTAVQKLAETYSPTRKHPDLAVARHPDHMQMVFNALRMATTVLTAELAVHGYHKGAENLRDTFSPAAMF
ncbi:hypothetical protein AOB60_00480 [Streptomyces noursei]|uniref:Uncharacterized protein n=2 Tax=Streptomyces noursei TaxID=1971 RepID=A0A2N8PQY4_STRNR|nr:hypothetical protein AOB60_00480 [Streptomyces noursei]